ncbi:MAG: carboxypeptidase-like regulatory domain-containing protein [Rhodothermales bacterium]|nr:carboxypeptidase-like regulatory domain-containing protein [Rhodothermales bacterium]
MKKFIHPNRSMGSLLAVLMVFSVVLVVACDENPVEPTTSGVAGRVISASTGKVVSGAQVSIGAEAVTTGQDGYFEFSDLVSGPATISCVVAGYQEFEQSITVTSGRTTLDISLIPIARRRSAAIVQARTYELTAIVEGFDPAWGDLTGAGYSALFTIHAHPEDASVLSGTLEDWRSIYVDGTETRLGSASLEGQVDREGNFVLESDRLGWALIGRRTASSVLTGSWGCCGHIAGSFRAVRLSERPLP